MTKPFISLTSDFGAQSQGVGLMMGAALEVAPDANVIHLMHGLPPFDIVAAARTLETAIYLPIGSHVCVCDPGVGSERKPLAVRTRRGDFLVGPDNGVLLPAAKRFGGIVSVREISNPKYMKLPVSPTFHGRDVFAPAAAHLALGRDLADFGPEIDPSTLKPPAYEDARIGGGKVHAQVIQINRFGSVHTNMLHSQWDEMRFSEHGFVRVESERGAPFVLRTARVFSDVPAGEDMILKDDYGRVTMARNKGSLASSHRFEIGDKVTIAAVTDTRGIP